MPQHSGRNGSVGEKIEECDLLRSAYQDQQAAGYMMLEELGSKLRGLEETRRLAQAELAALEAREERVRGFWHFWHPVS